MTTIQSPVSSNVASPFPAKCKREPELIRLIRWMNSVDITVPPGLCPIETPIVFGVLLGIYQKRNKDTV